MRRLGVAPRMLDFVRQVPGTVDSWFNQITERCGVIQQTSGPALADVPNNQWAIFKNTTTGKITLTANDNGVLKSVTLI